MDLNTSDLSEQEVNHIVQHEVATMEVNNSVQHEAANNEGALRLGILAQIQAPTMPS